MKNGVIVLFIYFFSVWANQLIAQDMLVATKVSQRASVTQRIGTTDVTIVYHSPLVRGRKIFGGIIPYNFVVDSVEYPWRAGSNQNTTIAFTHDVKIEGESLSKGIYALHIFVLEKEWTYIFSNNATNWGSFSYNKEEDALRVTVVPEMSEFQEWLSYDFVNREAESAMVQLHWANTKCAFKIEVDVTANILADLSSKDTISRDDYIKMANLTLKQDPSNIEQAIEYTDMSIALGENFQNKMLKAEMTIKNGQIIKGEKLKEEALAMAQNFDWYYYPLSLLLLDGRNEEAFQILSQQLEKEPDNWVLHLALGEYYIKDEDQKKAAYHYEKAYENAGERSLNYARYMYLCNKLILEEQTLSSTTVN